MHAAPHVLTVKPAPSPPPEPLPDVTNAVPVRDAGHLPSTSEQFRALQREIERNRPAVQSAKQKSDQLNAEATGLRRRLMETTARVQDLEDEKGRIDAELARLVPEERMMSLQFSGDRVRVARLLAVLERLQSDMPPVIAIKSDDALSAARGAMVLGDSVPRIYHEAAVLSDRLLALRHKRAELTRRKADSLRVSTQLTSARIELDQLLAIKSEEADAASAQYGDLQAQLDAAAAQASNLESLLAKVAALRQRPAGQGIVVVAAENGGNPGALRRGDLVRPVAGRMAAGGMDGVGGARAPGVTYDAPAGASVVAPARRRGALCRLLP